MYLKLNSIQKIKKKIKIYKKIMDLTYPKILQLSTTKKFKIFNIITFLIKNIDNKVDNISTTAGKK